MMQSFKRLVLASALAGFGLAAGGEAALAQHTNTPGSAAAVNQTITRQVGEYISQVLSDRQRELGSGLISGLPSNLAGTPGQKGRAGALGLGGISLWAGGSHNALKNTTASSNFTAKVRVGTVGADIRLTPWLVTGLAFAYERQDVTTKFNIGTLDTSGYSVSPYLVVRLLPNMYFDASYSHAWLDTDLKRSSETVFADYNSRRHVAAANFHLLHNIGALRLAGQVGYLYIHQRDDSYQESGASTAVVDDVRTTIGQGRIGVRAGYQLGGVEPFLSARYEHDFIRPGAAPFGAGVLTENYDRDGGVIGGGVRVNVMPNLDITVQGTSLVGRKNQSDNGVFGTIRFSF